MGGIIYFVLVLVLVPVLRIDFTQECNKNVSHLVYFLSYENRQTIFVYPMDKELQCKL